MNKTILAVSLVISSMVITASAGEKEKVAAARKVLKKHQNAIVWVSAVMKKQMTGLGAQFGHGRDQKVEALGTIIDASGLTVVSGSTLDPMSVFMSYAASMGGTAEQFKQDTQFSDVKMRLADGSEVPAKLILKDPDLDLTFVMPEKTEGEELPQFEYIKLGTAPKTEVLDEIVVLGRLDKSLNRQPTVGFGRVSAVITKPRTFFCSSDILGLGIPVFTLEGTPLGICLMRKGPRSAGMGNLMSGGMAPVILPGADVMEIAQQALKKKEAEPEKKTEKAPDKVEE